MTLYLIGLGLGDEKDITLRGLEAIKSCRTVYLENYTSSFLASIPTLEQLYSKTIILADRDLVEQHAEETILKDASQADTAFLVIGDPFGATTHSDLRMRAIEAGIDVKIIHNTSILNAIGETGLELYKFGKTTSIPFENTTVKAPYEAFRKNDDSGLHTLFLLDLDPSQQRFMTISSALDYLFSQGLDGKRICVGCSGIGSDNAQILCKPASHLKEATFTSTPQCLIIPSTLHFMEEDSLKLWQ